MLLVLVCGSMAQMLAQFNGYSHPDDTYTWEVTNTYPDFPMLVYAVVQGGQQTTLTLTRDGKKQSCTGHDSFTCHVDKIVHFSLNFQCVACGYFSVRVLAYQPQDGHIQVGDARMIQFRDIQAHIFKVNLTEVKGQVSIPIEYKIPQGQFEMNVYGCQNLTLSCEKQLPLNTGESSMVLYLPTNLSQYYIVMLGSNIRVDLAVHLFEESKEGISRVVERGEKHSVHLSGNQTAIFALDRPGDTLVCLRLWKGSAQLNLAIGRKQYMVMFHELIRQESCWAIKGSQQQKATFKINTAHEVATIFKIEFLQIQGGMVPINHNWLYQSLGYERYRYEIPEYISTHGENEYISLKLNNLTRTTIYVNCCLGSFCKKETKKVDIVLPQSKQFHFKLPQSIYPQNLTFQFHIVEEHYTLQLLLPTHPVTLRDRPQRHYLQPFDTMLFVHTSREKEVSFQVIPLSGQFLAIGADDIKAVMKDGPMSSHRMVTVSSSTGRFYLRLLGGTAGCLFSVAIRLGRLNGGQQMHFFLGKEQDKKQIQFRVFQDGLLVIEALKGSLKATRLSSDNKQVEIHSRITLQPGSYKLFIQKQIGAQAQVLVLLTKTTGTCLQSAVDRKTTLDLGGKLLSCLLVTLNSDSTYELTGGYVGAQRSPLFFQVFVGEQLIHTAKSYYLMKPKDIQSCSGTKTCVVKVSVPSLSTSTAVFIVHEASSSLQVLSGLLYHFSIEGARDMYLEGTGFPVLLFFKVIESRLQVVVQSGSQSNKEIKEGQQAVWSLKSNFLRVKCAKCVVQMQVGHEDVIAMPSKRVHLHPNQITIFGFKKSSSDKNTYRLQIQPLRKQKQAFQCFTMREGQFLGTLYSNVLVVHAGQYLISCKALTHIVDVTARVTVQTLSRKYMYMTADQPQMLLLEDDIPMFVFYKVDSEDPLSLFIISESDPPIGLTVFTIPPDQEQDPKIIIGLVDQYQMRPFQGHQMHLGKLKVGTLVGVQVVQTAMFQYGNLLMHNHHHAMPLQPLKMRRSISRELHQYSLQTHLNSVLIVEPLNYQLDVTVQIPLLKVKKTYLMGAGSHFIDLSLLGKLEGQSCLVNVDVRGREQLSLYLISHSNENSLHQNSGVYMLSPDEVYCFKFYQNKSTRLFINAEPQKNLLIMLTEENNWKDSNSFLESIAHINQFGLYTLTTLNRTGNVQCCIEEQGGSSTNLTIIRQTDGVHYLPPNTVVLWPVTRQKRLFQVMQLQDNVLLQAHYCSSHLPNVVIGNNLSAVQEGRDNKISQFVHINSGGFTVLVNETTSDIFFSLQADADYKQAFVLLHTSLVSSQIGNPYENVDLSNSRFFAKYLQNEMVVYIDSIMVKNAPVFTAFYRFAMVKYSALATAEKSCQIGKSDFERRWPAISAPFMFGYGFLNSTFRIPRNQIPYELFGRKAMLVLNFQYYYQGKRYHKYFLETHISEPRDYSKSYFYEGVLVFVLACVAYCCWRRGKRAQRQASDDTIELVP